MNDKEQLAAMGEHLAEQQPMCMAKRIEELEAQVRALTTPEDWQLVPVEPTRDMLSAGYFTNHEANRGIYNAMLAAAPKPEAK